MEAFEFFEKVYRGLQAPVKYIDAAYLNDEAGSRLNRRRKHHPQYYPGACETEILTQQTPVISNRIHVYLPQFDVVEAGVDNAVSSAVLLSQLEKHYPSFTYFSIGNSGASVDNMNGQEQGLERYHLEGDYLSILEHIHRLSRKPILLLYLGTNIGQFTIDQAQAFCRELYDRLLPGDLLLMGFDLKKNPSVILHACNDHDGIARQLNLNLLQRINRELEADFNLQQFDYFPVYDPVTGCCRTYLVSLRDQVVCIGEADFIYFEKNEPVFIQHAQKYTPEQIKALADANGFRLVKNFYDTKKWFVESLWRRES